MAGLAEVFLEDSFFAEDLAPTDLPDLALFASAFGFEFSLDSTAFEPFDFSLDDDLLAVFEFEISFLVVLDASFLLVGFVTRFGSFFALELVAVLGFELFALALVSVLGFDVFALRLVSVLGFDVFALELVFNVFASGLVDFLARVFDDLLDFDNRIGPRGPFD